MKNTQMMDQGLFDLVLGRIQKTFGKKFEVENVVNNTSIMIANIHNLFPVEATEHEVVLNNNDELEEDVNVSVTVYRLHSECESQEIFLQVTIQTEDIEGYIYHHYTFEQVQKEIEDTIDGNTCYVYNPVAENNSDTFHAETDRVINFTPDPEEIEFMKQAVVNSEDVLSAEPPLIASVEIPGGLKDEMNYLMFDTEHVNSLCDDLNDAYEKGVRYFLFENHPKDDNTTKKPTYKLVKLRSDYNYTEQGLKIPPFTLFVDGTVGETCININTHEIVTLVINQREDILDSNHIVILESNNTLTSGAFVKPLTEGGYMFYKKAINKYKNSIEELLNVFRIKSRFKLLIHDNLHNPRAKTIKEPEAPEDLSMFIKPEEDGE
jgi:hypothetical protein